VKSARLGKRVEVTLDMKADSCRVCGEPLPHGRDMSWPAIIGMFFGFWRGYIWTGAGFVHRHCLDVMTDRMWGRD
jgi:hypothetical protein